MQQMNHLLDNIRHAIRGNYDLQTVALCCRKLMNIQTSRLRLSGRPPLALRIIEQCIQNGDIFTLLDVCKSLKGRAGPLIDEGKYHGRDRIITANINTNCWNMWSADVLGACIEMTIPNDEIHLNGMKIVGGDLNNEYLAYKRDDYQFRIYISKTLPNIQRNFLYYIVFNFNIYNTHTPCDISFDKDSSSFKIKIVTTGIVDKCSPRDQNLKPLQIEIIPPENITHMRPSQRSLNYCSIFRKIEYISIVSVSVGICKYLRSSQLHTTNPWDVTRGEVGLFDVDTSRSYEYTHHPNLNFTVGNQIVVEEVSGTTKTKHTVGVVLYFRSHDGGNITKVYPGVFVNDKYYDPFAKIFSLNTIEFSTNSRCRIVRGSIGFRKILQQENEYNIYFVLAAIDDQGHCGLYFGYIVVDSSKSNLDINFYMSTTKYVRLEFRNVTAVACCPDGLLLAISDYNQTHIINISEINVSLPKSDFSGSEGHINLSTAVNKNKADNSLIIATFDHRTILSSRQGDFVDHLNINSKSGNINVTAATNMGLIVAIEQLTEDIVDHGKENTLMTIFSSIAMTNTGHDTYHFPKGRNLSIRGRGDPHIRKAKSDKYTYTCMAAYPYDNSIFVGTESGDILIYDNKLILQKTIKLHSLQICGLSYMNNQLLSADIGGKFKWTTSL